MKGDIHVLQQDISLTSNIYIEMYAAQIKMGRNMTLLRLRLFPSLISSILYIYFIREGVYTMQLINMLVFVVMISERLLKIPINIIVISASIVKIPKKITITYMFINTEDSSVVTTHGNA